MKSRSLIIYACFGLVMAGNIYGQDIRQEGRRYVAEIKKEFKTGAQGSLEMREITGDVTVKAWEQNKVEILETVNMEVFTMEEAKRVLEACQASYSQTGDIILVEGRDRPRRSSDSHFRISVPARFNLDIGTSGGDLSISQVKGTIKLRTSGGDVVLFETGGDVRASTSGGDVTVRSAEGRVSVKTSGGNLELEGIKGALDGQTSGGNITLRGASQTVDLRTSGGNINIIDVTGAVVAKTSGGDVEVDNSSGNVEVSTSGGDVVLRNIKGEVNASTSGGDVRAATLLGPANLRTSGGDITVRDLMARLQASTSGGTVSVEMTLADFSKPHDLSLSSSGGEVELTIPAKLPAKIYAEIRLGDGWNWGERYDIQSDFPLRIERDDKGERAGRYIRGEGEVNGGGDIISLRTSGGNIVIRKGH